jgi:hypothetical protein
MSQEQEEIELRLKTLINYAWDSEVTFESVSAWLENFDGKVLDKDSEQMLALFSVSRFLYFSKRMVREMLKSLFRDHFRAPLIQEIRKNYSNTRDEDFLAKAFEDELASTRFLGVGNPSESGAHLLYYFRQVNRLKKDLFIDLSAAFVPKLEKNYAGQPEIRFRADIPGVNRYIFFDDLVGSGEQASQYLGANLAAFKRDNPKVELKYLCLFGTSEGMARLNDPSLFGGAATCLFELDETYKAFHDKSRPLSGAPGWFQKNEFERMARGYGARLQPDREAGYNEGQLMIGFSHNTPDNTLPIFWDEGLEEPWSPVFIRFDKKYA